MEKEYYEWQERPLDMSDLIFLCMGILGGIIVMGFIYNYLAAIISLLFLVLLITLSTIKKKKMKNEG